MVRIGQGRWIGNEGAAGDPERSKGLAQQECVRCSMHVVGLLRPGSWTLLTTWERRKRKQQQTSSIPHTKGVITLHVSPCMQRCKSHWDDEAVLSIGVPGLSLSYTR